MLRESEGLVPRLLYQLLNKSDKRIWDDGEEGSGSLELSLTGRSASAEAPTSLQYSSSVAKGKNEPLQICDIRRSVRLSVRGLA
ncbi:hypothetical protein EVAR_31846_1 [Eumeta japonica]|uniref:Uncharacterized protein n=1 Tax=Eumeta variegata TaxID=151549 RepID=A0A4C1WIS4_EUMVA|nr:hypothetical protein EVAR_31846_1 [Eumeta japonica]